MKKSLIPFIIVILMGYLSLASCGEQKDTYKIGVSQCSKGRWRDKVNSEMLAAQHLYEQSAKVIIAHSYDDTEKQIKQIDSLAASGIDLLVVAPNESAPISA
ncbi:MAG: AraC family transcriptional regulator, partial [Prevotella sp.]|nr:AraC family transcriptional regulator [Prevotella sp.]